MTPFDNDAASTTGTSLSTGLDIPANGAAIVFSRGNASGNTLSLSAGLAADFVENKFENGNNSYLFGSDEFAALQTNRTITTAMRPGGTIVHAMASWEPA